MYEDFTVTDRWTGEPLHCVWKGTIVAIATRHADATDIRFAVNGKPAGSPCPTSPGSSRSAAPATSSRTRSPHRSPGAI